MTNFKVRIKYEMTVERIEIRIAVYNYVYFQVFSVLLMAISFTLVAATHNQSCYNEYEIKLSTRIAYKKQLKYTRNAAKELQTSLNDKLVEVQELNTSLNVVQEEADEIEILFNNLTTEVQELHTTCDGVLAVDCCEVRTKAG